MEGISNFFLGIYDFFTTLINMVKAMFEIAVTLVENLPYIANLLASFMVNIPGYFSWLPEGLSALLVTTFSIVVIYMVADRK